MRSLSTQLQSLISQRVLASIPYVKITRVIDQTPPITSPDLTDPFFASTHPFSNLFGSPADEPSAPFLLSSNFPVETMPHLPSPVSSGVDSLTRRISFTLVNIDYQDQTLYEFLTSEAALDLAQLLLEVLIIPTGEFSATDFINGDTTLGETVSYFSGEIDRVTSVSDVIECRAVSLNPVTPWKLVPDDAGSPRDRGLRLPLVLGKNAIVSCVTLQIGSFTVISQNLKIGSDTIAVDNISGFGTTGSAMVAAEKVAWTGKAENLLTGVTRAEDGTIEADHVLGTFVFELGDDVVLGVSSLPVSGLNALFVLGPSGTSTRVTPLVYSVTLDDETNTPGSSGDGITTITFTTNQISGLVSQLHADAAVIRQAEYTNDDPDQTQQTDAVPFANQSLIAGTGAQGTWTNVGNSNVNWTFSKGSSNTQDLTGFYDLTDFTASSLFDSLQFIRFAFTLDVNTVSGGTLAVGLALSGAEGVLTGVTDGVIVATTDITTTGVHVIEGGLYIAEENALVASMGTFVIDFVKGPAPGGNPNFDIDITEVRMFYSTIDDTTSSTSLFRGWIADDALGNIPNVNSWAERDGTTLGGVDYSSSMFWNGRHTTITNGNESLGAVYERDVGGAEDFHYAEVNLDGALYDPQPVSPGPGEDFAWYEPATSPAPDPGVLIIDTIKLRLGKAPSGPIVETDSGNNVSINAVLYNGTRSDVVLTQVVKTNSFSSPGSGSTTEMFFEWKVEDSEIRAGLVADSFDWANDLRVAVWGSDGYVPGSGTGDKLAWSDMSFTYTLAVKSLFVPIDRPIDAQIQASAGGAGLQFFAVCDGPEADDGTWNAASGEVLEHPGDLMRFWLEDVHGLTNVDTSAFSGSTYATATPNYQFGFDARNMGSTFEQVLLRMGYEGSANVCQPSGGDWTLFFPNISGNFGSPIKTLTGIGNLISIGKDTDEISTRLTVFSHFDPRFESTDNRSFSEVQTTDPTAGAVIAREVEFGRRDADPMFLFAHNNTDGVTQWRGYIEKELGRSARIFAFRSDHWEGFALEIGDVVEIEDPRIDGGSAVKSRVIEVEHSRSQGVLLRLAEVT